MAGSAGGGMQTEVLPAFHEDGALVRVEDEIHSPQSGGVKRLRS